MAHSAGARRFLAAGAAVVAAIAGAVGGALVVAGCGATAGAATQASPVATVQSPAPPLRVVAVRPRHGAAGAPADGALVIRFSAPIASDAVHPRLRPRVPGTWELRSPATLVFRPAGHWPPLATIRVVVPAGRSGVRGAAGGRLVRRYTTTFTTGAGSTLRLQQLLADLGYLPLRFRAAHTGSRLMATTQADAGLTAATQAGAGLTAATSPDLVSLKALPGRFVWRYPRLRPVLGSLWRPRAFTVLTRGAVMAFEADHGLTSDGAVGARVWSALLTAVARHEVSRHPYDVIQVSMAGPETLSVWQGGRIAYRSLANTGIASRPTAPGTFPVYARYLSTTMSGTNPDGSHYSDPGVPWVAYFNGGDAVHGFIRGSYGWPQSLGCVELPYSAAAVVYRYDPIGTLVTVS
ncbi:MAG TPA: L,D-transpeptidase family protein [Thermoleophilia bacterium]|nr:L,D-transpeptidase family protein [Thermoleophilia bacterium]